MAVVRPFNSAQVLVSEGGAYAPDLPIDRVGVGNYLTKDNWRREDGAEVAREGWDYFAPNSGGSTTPQSTIAGSAILAIREIRRPNGLTALVAVAADKVYRFDYDTSAWVQIGSGYSTSSIRRWEIINVAGYAVFNNGIDTPFTWQIGDSSVTPIYEFREAGYASVGTISEYSTMLVCGDILEINSASMAGIMNGVSPYGTITDVTKTTRVQFRQLWSNLGAPRDFAATIPCASTSGSANLTLTYPIKSLVAGDSITVIGAGPSGGNLVTTVSSYTPGSTTIVMATVASTAVASTTVQKTSALSSVVGFFDLEDDGSAIVRLMPLQNRIVAYKTNSIFVGYYTGDLDEPFTYDRVYHGKRTPRFAFTLADVGGRYHIFAGDEHFYRFYLGSQEPRIDPQMDGCRRSQFYSLVAATDQYGIYAEDNGCTNEILFSFPYNSGANRAMLAYDYTDEDPVVSRIDGAFTCMCQVHKPMATNTSSDAELWFVMGDAAGRVTRYGKSNLAVLTRQRYGADFTRTLTFGLSDFGDPFNEKDVRSWAFLSTGPSSVAAATLTLYGYDYAHQSAATLLSKTILNSSGTPGLVPLYYRKIYFQDSISVSSATNFKVNGRLWEWGVVRSRSITRIA